MTHILQKIEEILKREFLLTPKGGTYYLLEKNEPNHPPTLLKQRGKLLVYSFDAQNSNEAIFPIFNSQIKGLTSIADYIIFYPKNDILFVFVCNLKSRNVSNANKQAEASWQMSEYIIATTMRMLNFPKDLKVEYRLLLFCQKNINRFTTNTKSISYDLLSNSGLKNIRLEAGEDCYLDLYCK